jgi:hypothetical protein
MDTNEAYLPRIQCIFYSTFDLDHGPKIMYQVPEDSISVSPPPSRSVAPRPPPPPTSGDHLAEPEPVSLITSIPPTSRHALAASHSASPSSKLPASAHTTSPLFEFDSISEYVIPREELCGKLVICNTPRHRIIGYPVYLEGKRYKRYAFRYNLCFVFDRMADLSCYESIVRKCARVLLACEVYIISSS